MTIQPVKGTRDFYPDDMRVRNWLFDAWRRVALRNGFEEYDSPIFEYLDLYTAKSGAGIVSELFSFTDRGGRALAIRPETTPTLARMVNAKINSLPRPIKWFCIQRLCRAEKPQKGRLREFFQWNIDVVGEDSVLADAECIFAAVDFLREVGLTPKDVQVRVGSRPLTIAALKAAAVPGDRTAPALAVLDKRPKVGDEEFLRLAAQAGFDAEQVSALKRFQDCSSVDQIKAVLGQAEGVGKGIEDLRGLWRHLLALGAVEYCTLDMRIVRGLAYYTGIVYEILDVGGSVPRAVAGGGRYDDLLEVLGGPKVGATGFAMGDVVLGILLEEKGLIPAETRTSRLDFFVIDGAEGLLDKVMELAGLLRLRGWSADWSYKRQSLSRQLKEANRRGARCALIVQEGAATVSVKDLAAGAQKDMQTTAFLAGIGRKSQQSIDAIFG